MWWLTGTDEQQDSAVAGNSQQSTQVPGPGHSPGGLDAAAMSELKDQFEQQQQMIEQLKELVRENEQQLRKKEHDLSETAGKLSKIKLQYKARITQLSNQLQEAQKKGAEDPSTARSEADDASMDTSSAAVDSSRGKILMLKRQLEENRAMFEKREKTLTNNKRSIEQVLEGLKLELAERDQIIAGMKMSSVAAGTEDICAAKEHSEPPNDAVANEMYAQIVYKDSRMLELNNRILELEGSVMDLQENLKEKDEVIRSRNRAIQLMTEDLSRRGKVVVDQLDDTRDEMRLMQQNFAMLESEWTQEKLKLNAELEIARERLERMTTEKDIRIADLKNSVAQLEGVRFDLSTRNAELQTRIVLMQDTLENIQSKQSENGDLSMKDLNKEISALRDELRAKEVLIRDLQEMESGSKDQRLMKLKQLHKGKIKSLEAKIRKLEQGGVQSEEVAALQNKVVELEEEKGNLQLKLVDFDELIDAQARSATTIKELRHKQQQQCTDLSDHVRMISMLENEKLDLHERLARDERTRSAVSDERQRLAEAKIALEMRLVEMEESRDVAESMCLDLRKEVNTVKARLEERSVSNQCSTRDVQQQTTNDDVRNSLDELRAVLNSAETERDELKLELESKEAELQDTCAVLQELQNELCSMKQCLEDANTARAEALDLLAARDEETNRQNSRNVSLQDTVSALEKDLRELEASRDKLAEDHATVSRELTSMKESASSQEAGREELNGALAVLRLRLEDETARSKRETESLSGLVLERDAVIRSLQEELSEAARESEERVAGLNSAIEAQGNELQILIECRDVEDRKWDGRMSSLVEQLSEMEAEVGGLQQRLLAERAEAERLVEERDVAVDEVRILKAKVEDCESALLCRNEETANLRNDLRNKAEEAESFELQSKRLKDEVNLLRKCLEDTETASREKMTMIQELTDEIQMKEGQLGDSLKMLNASEINVRDQSEEVEALQNQITESEELAKLWKSKCQSLEADLQQTTAKLSDLRESSQEAIDDAQVRRRQLEAEILQLRQNVVEMNAACADQTAGAAELRQSFHERAEELAAAQRLVHESNRERAEAEKELERARMEHGRVVDGLRDEVQRLSSVVETLRTADGSGHEEEKAGTERLEDELARAKSELREARMSLEAAESELQASRSRADDARAELAECQNAVKELTDVLQRVYEERDLLESKGRDLESRLAAQKASAESEIDAMRQQLLLAASERDAVLESVRAEHERSIESLKSEMERRDAILESVRSEHEKTIESLKSEMERRDAIFESVRQENERSIESLKSETERRDAILESVRAEDEKTIYSIKREMERRDAILESVRSDHERAIESLKSETERRDAILSCELDEARSDTSAVEDERARTAARCSELESRNAELKNSVERLRMFEEEFHRSVQETESSRSDAKRFAAEVERLGDQNQRLLTYTQQLESDLSSTADAVKQLEADRDASAANFDARLTELVGHVDELRKQLDERAAEASSRSAIHEKLSVELAAAVAQKTRLEYAYERAQQELAELSEKLAEEADGRRREALADLDQRHHLDVVELQRQILAATKDRELLEEKLESSEERARELSLRERTLAQENASLAEKVRDSEAELNAVLGMNQGLESQVADANAEVIVGERRAAEMGDAVRALEAQLRATAGDLSSDAAESRPSLDGVRAENDALRSEAERLAQKIRVLECGSSDQVQSLSRQLDAADREAVDLRAEAALHAERLGASEAEVSQLRDELHATETVLQQAEGELGAKDSLLEELAGRHERCASTVASLEERLSGAERELEECRRTLASRDEQLGGAELGVRSALSENQTLKLEVEEIGGRLRDSDARRSHLEGLQDTVEELRSCMDVLRSEKMDLLEESERRQRLVEQLDLENEQLRLDISELAASRQERGAEDSAVGTEPGPAVPTEDDRTQWDAAAAASKITELEREVQVLQAAVRSVEHRSEDLEVSKGAEDLASEARGGEVMDSEAGVPNGGQVVRDGGVAAADVDNDVASSSSRKQPFAGDRGCHGSSFDLASRNAVLEQQVQTLEASAQLLTCRLKALAEDNEQMKEQMARQRLGSERSAGEASRAEERFQTSPPPLEEPSVAAGVQQLRNQLAVFKIKNEKMLAKLKVFKGKNDKLQLQINDQTSHQEALEDANMRLRDVNVRASDEIRRLNAELTGVERLGRAETQMLHDRLDVVEVANAKLVEMKEDLERRLSSAAAVNRTLEDAMSELTADAERAKKDTVATDENERLRRELEGVRKQNETLDSDGRELQALLATERAKKDTVATDENERLRRQLESLCQQNELLDSDNREFQSLLAKGQTERSRLEHEMRTQRDVLARLTEEHEGTRAQLEALLNVDLRQLRQKYDGLQKDHKDLQNLRLQLESDAEALRAELDVAEAQKAALQSQVADLWRRLEEVQQQSHRVELEALKDDLKARKDEVVKKNEELVHRVSDLHEDLSRTLQTHERPKTELEDTADVRQLKAALAEATARNGELMQAVSRLEGELWRLEDEKQQLLEDVDATEHRYRRHQSDVEFDRLLQQNAQLSQSLSEHGAVVERLEKSKEEVETEARLVFQQQQGTIQDLRKRLDEADGRAREAASEDLEAVKAELALQLQKVVLLEAQNSELGHEVERQTEAEARSDEVGRLRDENEALEQQLANLKKHLGSVVRQEPSGAEVPRPAARSSADDGWDADERNAKFAARISGLEAELQQSMQSLHLRDQRCEEFTSEIARLLDERDSLQLRLSAAIRSDQQREVSMQLLQRDLASRSPSVASEAETDFGVTVLSAVDTPGEADHATLCCRLRAVERKHVELLQLNAVLERMLTAERENGFKIMAELKMTKEGLAAVERPVSPSDETRILLGDDETSAPSLFPEHSQTLVRSYTGAAWRIANWIQGRRVYFRRSLHKRPSLQLLFYVYFFVIHALLLLSVS